MLVLLVGALAAACAEGDLPEVVARGTVVDVAPFGGGPVCAGSVRMLDRAVGEVADRLGLADEGRITFYWGPDGPQSHCPAAATDHASVHACAPLGERSIIGSLASFGHELVHVLSRPVGRATPLVEEGLAIHVSGQCVSVRDPRPLTSYVGPQIAGSLVTESYAVGGSLVGYLVEEHGMARLVDLKGRAPVDVDPATFDAAILDVYGRSRAEVEQQWQSERVESLCGPRLELWPEPPALLPPEGATLRSTLRCDDPKTYGPIDPTALYGDGLTTEPLIRGMFGRHSLLVPQATRVLATMDGPPGTKAHLTSRGCWDGIVDDSLFDPELPGLAVITVVAGETRELLLGGCYWSVYLVSEDYDEVDVMLDLEPLE